jgi:hypothetical protein
MVVKDEDIRLAVYRRFAETGLEPTIEWLVIETGADDRSVRSALRRLAEQRQHPLDRTEYGQS